MTFLQALSAVNLKPSCAEEVVNADFTLVIRFPSVNVKTSSRTRDRILITKAQDQIMVWVLLMSLVVTISTQQKYSHPR